MLLKARPGYTSIGHLGVEYEVNPDGYIDALPNHIDALLKAGVIDQGAPDWQKEDGVQRLEVKVGPDGKAMLTDDERTALLKLLTADDPAPVPATKAAVKGR